MNSSADTVAKPGRATFPFLGGGWGLLRGAPVQFTAMLNSIYSPWMGIQPFTGFINYSPDLPLSARWSLPFSRIIRETDSCGSLLKYWKKKFFFEGKKNLIFLCWFLPAQSSRKLGFIFLLFFIHMYTLPKNILIWFAWQQLWWFTFCASVYLFIFLWPLWTLSSRVLGGE